MCAYLCVNMFSYVCVCYVLRRKFFVRMCVVSCVFLCICKYVYFAYAYACVCLLVCQCVCFERLID